jgi:hypothetical protein
MMVKELGVSMEQRVLGRIDCNKLVAESQGRVTNSGQKELHINSDIQARYALRRLNLSNLNLHVAHA